MAFDFDDMEAEAAARLEAGEDDDAVRIALGGIEGPGAWKGGLLPPMRNTSKPGRQHLPALLDLPTYLPPKMVPEEQAAGGARARLFVFYGAGDSVGLWARCLPHVPDWLDVAWFETPGHGSRKTEHLHPSVEDIAKEAFDAVSEVLSDHCRGGVLEGAPFALLGHSMGAQVMVEVAALAKKKLGLEPICMFAVDRAAPHLSLYTEEGYGLLCLDEPLEFFQGFNPLVARMMQEPKRSAEHERIIRMWQRDLRSSQEHVWAKGHHIFHCEIHVFRALENFGLDQQLKDGKKLPPEAMQVHEINCRVTTSGPDSSSVWSWGSYEEWEAWTTERCQVHNINAHHEGVKCEPETWKAIADALSKLLGPAF